MNRKRSQLQSYLAGIVDGEGSFGIYHDKRGNGCWFGRLTIGMSSPLAVGLFKSCYSETNIQYSTNKTGTPMFIATVSGNKAYEIAKELLPFLVVKYEECKVFLSYLAHMRRDHWPFGNDSWDCKGKCERYAKTIKLLKNKRVKSVNLQDLREYRAKPEDVEKDRSIITSLLEGVETKHRETTPVEAISALEQDIVQI